jgi:hypothetical protein
MSLGTGVGSVLADGPLQVRWHTDSYVNVPFE